MKKDCYNCAYREQVPGSAHSKCKFAWSKAELRPPIASQHGINSGWYIFPLNYDPVWQEEECQAHSTEADPDMKDDSVFDPKLLNSLQSGKIKYFIGVDTYDKNALAYCLGKEKDGDFELLLAKTMNDEEKFKEEVTNLAEYFNAKMRGEVD